MSRSEQPLSEIPCGVNLVVILEASMLKDHNDMPIIKEGSYGIKIRFNDNKLNTDKIFWTKSSEFIRLCNVTASDRSKPICPELRGKRLWLCVKEIKLMAGEKHISSAFEPFDYIKCDNPAQAPFVSGDPKLNSKGAFGEFVEYVQQEGISVEKFKELIKESLNGEELPIITPEMDKAMKLELARQIIAEGESKQMTSLNEQNKHDEISENEGKDVEAEDPFELEEGPGESEDNNHVEDDWNDL